MADQVINWLLLLRSGRATAQDYEEFLAWRAADPSHENAWQQLSSSLAGSAFGRLGDAYPVGYPTSDAEAPPPAPVPGSRRRFLAGGLALACTGAFAGYVGNAYYPLSSVAADAATPSLFPEERQVTDLSHAMDAINRKFGKHAVRFGGVVGSEDTAPTRIAFTQIPKFNPAFT